jgi:hypothetical protein
MRVLLTGATGLIGQSVAARLAAEGHEVVPVSRRPMPSAPRAVVTDGLQKRHGSRRVFDAPIAEGGQVAVAIGMGAYGLRPVVKCQFADYIYPAFDQLVSVAARLRYRSAGEFSAPITIRSPYGGGIFGGQTHSQSPEGLFTHVCGLKNVIPSPPAREELTGSTITVTSLGPLGGLMATPIINPPEVAVIGVNRIRDKLFLANGEVRSRRVMNLSSSFDHRIIDGFVAASFIAALRGALEEAAQPQ